MTQIKSQLRPTSLNFNILKRRPHDSCVNGKNMLIAENRPELQRNFNWLESVKTRPTPVKKNRAIPVRTGYYGKINTFVRLYNGNCINSERVSKPI